jgi:dienelactone hydrolase
MKTQRVAYRADGLNMDSQLFYEPSTVRQPGILVFPEAFGLGTHAVAHAERLSRLGYVTLACDLHGDRRLVRDMNEVMALLEPLRTDVARIRARASSALTALVSCPQVDSDKIAAIGYCFGGTMALELARGGANIAGVVGLHSGLATVAPQDAKNIRAKVLVCIGADDPAVPAEQRRAFEEEMRAGEVNWQMSTYGGVVHSFTNPAAAELGRPELARYDTQADARSWQQMRTFFDEIFGAGPVAARDDFGRSGCNCRRFQLV